MIVSEPARDGGLGCGCEAGVFGAGEGVGRDVVESPLYDAGSAGSLGWFIAGGDMAFGSLCCEFEKF